MLRTIFNRFDRRIDVKLLHLLNNRQKFSSGNINLLDQFSKNKKKILKLNVLKVIKKLISRKVRDFKKSQKIKIRKKKSKVQWFKHFVKKTRSLGYFFKFKFGKKRLNKINMLWKKNVLRATGIYNFGSRSRSRFSILPRSNIYKRHFFIKIKYPSLSKRKSVLNIFFSVRFFKMKLFKLNQFFHISKFPILVRRKFFLFFRINRFIGFLLSLLNFYKSSNIKFFEKGRFLYALLTKLHVKMRKIIKRFFKKLKRFIARRKAFFLEKQHNVIVNFSMLEIKKFKFGFFYNFLSLKFLKFFFLRFFFLAIFFCCV